MDDMVKRLRELSKSVAPSEMHRACGWAADRIEELERQLAECQRERDMLRKFHHDQQELHERNEANAQTNRLRLLQIVELRAACKRAFDALEGCINDPKMRHTDTVHYATQDALDKLREALK